MKMSSSFSDTTSERLNYTTFDELDAAEKRLSMAGFDLHLAYLKSKMTADELQVIAYCEERTAAIIAAARGEVKP